MTKTIVKFIFITLFIVLFTSISNAQIIQSQEYSQNDNVAANLMNVRVSNNIITLKFKIKNSGKSEKLDFYFKDCFIIDEKNQKKYYTLKDSEGKYIGGPFSSDGGGGRFEFWIEQEKSQGLWIKCPLPPDNPETISISIPGFMPFEGIKLPSLLK